MPYLLDTENYNFDTLTIEVAAPGTEQQTLVICYDAPFGNDDILFYRDLEQQTLGM